MYRKKGSKKGIIVVVEHKELERNARGHSVAWGGENYVKTQDGQCKYDVTL
jgi:hypothetical protein